MSQGKTKPFRVLFVCMGNICRSPAAEIVFRHRVEEEDLGACVEIDSAGTIDYHAGKPPDKRMAAALSARGYEIAGRSRHVKPEDFEHFDVIVPMDLENDVDLREFFCPDPALEEKIRPFAGFCTRHRINYVPDPYHGGPEGFERVADIVEDGCEGMLEFVREQLGEK